MKQQSKSVCVLLTLVGLLILCSRAFSLSYPEPYPEGYQALLILEEDDEYAETEATVVALEEAGAHAMHVIGYTTTDEQQQVHMYYRAVIAYVPVDAEEEAEALAPGGFYLERLGEYAPEFDPDADGLDLACGADAWNHLIDGEGAGGGGGPGEPPAGDLLEADVEEGAASYTPGSAAPGYYEPSEFMIGKVAVGVILPESEEGAVPPGLEENWTFDRQEEVFNEIVEGLNWWRGLRMSFPVWTTPAVAARTARDAHLTTSRTCGTRSIPTGLSLSSSPIV